MNKLLGYLVSICTVVFLTGTVSVPAMAQSTTSTEVAILPETPAEIAQQIQDEVAEIPVFRLEQWTGRRSLAWAAACWPEP